MATKSLAKVGTFMVLMGPAAYWDHGHGSFSKEGGPGTWGGSRGCGAWPRHRGCCRSFFHYVLGPSPPFLVPVSAGALQHCGHVILAEPCDLGSTRDPLSVLKEVSLVWGPRHVILAAM